MITWIFTSHSVTYSNRAALVTSTKHVTWLAFQPTFFPYCIKIQQNITNFRTRISQESSVNPKQLQFLNRQFCGGSVIFFLGHHRVISESGLLTVLVTALSEMKIYRGGLGSIFGHMTRKLLLRWWQCDILYSKHFSLNLSGSFHQCCPWSLINVPPALTNRISTFFFMWKPLK